MALFRTPGNDAFAGGQRINVGPPPSIGGSLLTPPGGGPTQPTNGVAPSGINFARNNRGSNITIPHARVVPVAPKVTELVDIDTEAGRPLASRLGHLAADGTRREDGGMREAETLGAGRIGFVLGNRSDEGQRVGNEVTIPGRATNQLSNRMWETTHNRMGTGVDRVDRMCSLEYLQRYVKIATRGLRLNLTGITTADAAARSTRWTSGLLQTVRPLLDNLQANLLLGAGAGGLDVDAKSIVAGDFGDFCAGGLTTSAVTASSATAPGPGLTALYMGLLVHDIHPFIRGKSYSTGLVDLNSLASNNMPADGNNRRFLVPRSLPDQLAITLLEKALEQRGLFEWRPDGIVLSKEHSGQTDMGADLEFDMQLQQLFNVAVQGPATLTNLVGNKTLLTMPGDLVFVVIVCDRYTPGAGPYLEADGATTVVDRNGVNLSHDNVWDLGLAPGDMDTYNMELFAKWREDQFSGPLGARNGQDYRARLEQYRTGRTNSMPSVAVVDRAQLGNFRVRMSTSSQMTNYSDPHCPVGAVEWKPPATSMDRMGLRMGPRLAEYILGGWCVGRVLDSAASRAQVPTGFTNANPTSFAVTVDTHVEWWSGDKMFRHFCDVDGKFRQRGHNNYAHPGGGPLPPAFTKSGPDIATA